MNIFQERKVVIATKHHKELVIAPIIEKELGMISVLVDEFDSDQFGTFSGEIVREYDPIETARKKCELAMKLSNCDMAIASEGSFGPHPSTPFLSVDDEVLLFIDQKNSLEVVVRTMTTETNFNGSYVSNESELNDFLEMILFPSHGVILKPCKENTDKLIKGVADKKMLFSAFHQMMAAYGSVYVETDMRAMYNPTRMKQIEKTTTKLAIRLKSTCPNCENPGYGITDVKEGLPCSNCGSPTSSILSHIYECQACKYSSEVKYPNNKSSEEPMYCQNCNP